MIANMLISSKPSLLATAKSKMMATTAAIAANPTHHNCNTNPFAPANQQDDSNQNRNSMQPARKKTHSTYTMATKDENRMAEDGM